MKIGFLQKIILLAAVVAIIALLFLGTPYLPKEKTTYIFYYVFDNPSASIKFDFMKLYPYKYHLITAISLMGLVLFVKAKER
jgi:hypothetical protein